MTFLFNGLIFFATHIYVYRNLQTIMRIFSNGIQRDDFFGITSGRSVVDAVVCATSKGTSE